jgi:aspartate-semialdehyde dehydrogenase
MKKIPVGILGATGNVGQRFIELLIDHPWFEIVALTASEKNSGKTYQETGCWRLGQRLPASIASMPLLSSKPNLPCDIVFSGLDSSVAGEIETAFAEAGYTVISNAKNHRMNEKVPLLIPEINPLHLDLLPYQPFEKGKIITNPNCAAIGLALALKPLHEAFEVEQVHVVTFQSISGAGYPGVASLDIFDNVIPFIVDEEQKLETELKKILGEYKEGSISFAPISISAQCNRVPVSEGHLECVSVKLKKKTTPAEIIEAWRSFSSLPQHLKLPSAPLQPLHYFDEHNYPQPRLHRHLDKGMAVSLGRLRACPIMDYKFVLLSHNTIRGAAGGAILNAELLTALSNLSPQHTVA